MANKINIESLIEKVKGKKKVEVHSHTRHNPDGSLSRVDQYARFIDDSKEEDKIEDLDEDTMTVSAEDEGDYADEDIPISELTPLEKANLPKIDSSELPNLIESWQKYKDPKSLEKLLQYYNGIIHFHAKKYTTAPIPNDLTVLEAKRLLIKAADTFDTSKKTSFNTHLTNYLKKLYRFIGDNQNIAKIPEQRIRKINNYKTAFAKLEDKYNRQPTEAELADELSWSIKEVHRIKSELGRAEILQFGEDYSYSDLGLYSEKVPRALKIVYFDAGTDQRFILEHTTNIVNEKPMSIPEIAKHLKISESKVKGMISEINKKIIELL